MNATARAKENSPVIEARQLGRQFDRSHWAVENVDLTVDGGELFGLIGPDGAGKTTLIQMFAAILDPSMGACTVLGFDTVKEASSITKSIGYMSQSFTLYDRLTVEENLAFSARIRMVGRAEYVERRARLLEMARLIHVPNRRADALSGGMRKKLSLCANLIHLPPLLLLDELSLGVDPLSRRDMWSMLDELCEHGTTIVVSTPYMDEAERCHRVAFLNEGRLVAVGKPHEIAETARGRVFETRTERRKEMQRVLSDNLDVLGVQALPDRLRFQMRSQDALTPALRNALAEMGELNEATPSVGDAFIHLTHSDSARESLAQITATSHHEWPKGAAIQVENVTCAFGEFKAVDNVTLEVLAGQTFGFLGPNGAGKTTLIRALCGLIRPVSGSMTVSGVDVMLEPKKLAERIGYMSQRFSLYLDLTPDENLEFFAGVYGFRGRAKTDAMKWARLATGLTGTVTRKVANLSGAYRQRLALACSIVHRPPVVFLDEPTSGVDPLSRYRFWQLIRLLADDGIAVFVTTHYLEEAEYCDRLGFMYEGRLIASGTANELREAYGAAPDATIQDVFMAYIEREAQKNQSTTSSTT